MSRPSHSGRSAKSKGARDAAGAASQRQLRAGELVRHALAEILRASDIADPRLAGVSVTVTEVRVSPDLRHATCFVEPLGAGIGGPGLQGLGGDQAQTVVDGLNHAARFLRGQLGRAIALKFTPDLHFVHDKSFGEAAHMNALFNRPEVRRDLEADPSSPASGGGGGEADGGGDATVGFKAADTRTVGVTLSTSFAGPPPPRAGED